MLVLLIPVCLSFRPTVCKTRVAHGTNSHEVSGRRNYPCPLLPCTATPPNPVSPSCLTGTPELHGQSRTHRHALSCSGLCFPMSSCLPRLCRSQQRIHCGLLHCVQPHLHCLSLSPRGQEDVLGHLPHLEPGLVSRTTVSKHHSCAT